MILRKLRLYYKANQDTIETLFAIGVSLTFIVGLIVCIVYGPTIDSYFK